MSDAGYTIAKFRIIASNILKFLDTGFSRMGNSMYPEKFHSQGCHISIFLYKIYNILPTGDCMWIPAYLELEMAVLHIVITFVCVLYGL